jgi:hypothetical protein
MNPPILTLSFGIFEKTQIVFNGVNILQWSLIPLENSNRQFYIAMMCAQEKTSWKDISGVQPGSSKKRSHGFYSNAFHITPSQEAPPSLFPQ